MVSHLSNLIRDLPHLGVYEVHALLHYNLHQIFRHWGCRQLLCISICTFGFWLHGRHITWDFGLLRPILLGDTIFDLHAILKYV